MEREKSTTSKEKSKTKRTPNASDELRKSERQNEDASSEGWQVKHPGGRPTDYSSELADKICQELIKPRPLIDICKDAGMPERETVHRWLVKHPEFSHKYRVAREHQADAYADEIITIADTSDADNVCDEYGNIKPNHEWIARSKLRVDARKWYASKVAPKKYGDKVEQTVIGDPERPQEHRLTVDIRSMNQEELKAFIRDQTHGKK
jgi:hypothetical protein